MTTRLTDLIVPVIFNALVNGAIADKSKFRAAGLIVQNPEFDRLATSAGVYGSLPFWAPIAYQEANSNSDDPAVLSTARKTNQAAMTFRLFQRNLSFASMDLVVRNASGGDATAFAASEFSRLWALEEEYLGIAMLNGLAARNITSNASDMLVSVSRTTGTIDATNQLTAATLARALGTAGDNLEGIDTIIMHSEVFAGIRARDANAFIPASATGFGIPTFCGLKVVVSDKATKDTTVPLYPVYTNYLVGPGVFAVGVGETSVAVERNETAGNGAGRETIFSRRSFIMHPQGHALAATAPTNGLTFTNAELSAQTHWSRVMDRKVVPVAYLRTNA